MSLKSIFRRLWARRPVWAGTDLADVVRGVTPQPTPFLDRLTARLDWGPRPLPDWAQPPRPIVTDGEGVDPNRPPSPPWPAHDDPYTDPGPCVVVTDPALSTIGDYAARTNENTRRLADRGLAGRPFDSVKSVTDLLQLIERQEAAEKELIHRGMEWDPIARRWRDPETE